MFKMESIMSKKAQKKLDVVNVTINPDRIAHADELAQTVIFGLSNLFNYMITYEDRDGTTVSVNTMRYTLTTAYNGLAYSLSRQKDWLSTQLDTQRERAKEALFAANGTEISIQNINRATERLERIEEEMAALDLLLSKCVAAHNAISSKAFEYKAQPKPMPSKNVDVSNVSVQHLARKLGVSLDSLPNTNGVN
jgi:hypothetical protein